MGGDVHGYHEAGVWTELQGVEAMLQVLVGERPAATINGFADVVR